MSVTKIGLECSHYVPFDNYETILWASQYALLSLMVSNIGVTTGGPCHSGCPPQKVSPGHYPLADIVLPDTIRNTDSVPPSGFCPTTRNTGISFSSRVLWSKYRNYGLIIDHQIEKLILLIALLNKISQILNATLFIKLYCVDGEDFCSFH